MNYQEFLETYKEQENQMLYLKNLTKLTAKAFSEKYNIHYRTFEKWCSGERTPPPYVAQLLTYAVLKDLGEI